MKNIRSKIILFMVNHILVGTKFFSLKRYLLLLDGLKIGKNTNIVGPIYYGSSIKIEIGERVWIGKNVFFDGNGEVSIGNNVDIAPHVIFSTGGHEIGDSLHRAGTGKVYKIKVADGCWIGTRATLVGDIIVNSGVVVGAMSLVKDSVPSNALVGGNPAKIKKNYEV